jgi:hypothetical protein
LEGVAALKSFFKKASSLTSLDLDGTNLGPEGIKLLSLELGGIPSLNILRLRRNNIGDEGLEGISMLCFSKLTHLNLGQNGIGRRGSEALTDLLRSDESSLVELNLQSNAIDDESAEILGRSLLHNTTVEMLRLEGNEHVSCVGWKYLCRLVCDTSSVSATFRSNHTLRMIYSVYPQAQSAQLLQLKRALRENGRPGTLKDKAHRKIIHHHFHSEKRNNSGPLLDMDAKIMPRVFSWINQRSDEDFGDGSRNNSIYQILRTLNVRAFVREDIALPRSIDDVGGGRDRGREMP